jgi:hypothetical protein
MSRAFRSSLHRINLLSSPTLSMKIKRSISDWSSGSLRQNGHREIPVGGYVFCRRIRIANNDWRESGRGWEIREQSVSVSQSIGTASCAPVNECKKRERMKIKTTNQLISCTCFREDKQLCLSGFDRFYRNFMKLERNDRNR